MKDKELRQAIENGEVKDEELRKILVDLRIIQDIKKYASIKPEKMKACWIEYAGNLFDEMTRGYRRIERDSIERDERLGEKIDQIHARFEMLLEHLDLHVTEKVKKIEQSPEYKTVEVIEKRPLIRLPTEQERDRAYE